MPTPLPGPGELLVRVEAAAIIVTELEWDETYNTAAGAPRPFPIPGRDLCGIVAEVGPGATDTTIGQAVYGMLGYGRDGAQAEYAIALPREVVPKPATIDDVLLSAVPLSALTAWQGLFTHASLSKGQRVLIHGASGGVGTYAVQLARWAGAHVIATASQRNAEFLRELGAEQIIDYSATRFEEVVRDVDVVFDLVGGDTLARSWHVVRKSGVIVSVVDPSPPAAMRESEVGFVYFIVEPSGQQLSQIGGLLESGDVRPIVNHVYPLTDARRAYEAAQLGHPRGKVVLTT